MSLFTSLLTFLLGLYIFSYFTEQHICLYVYIYIYIYIIQHIIHMSTPNGLSQHSKSPWSIVRSLVVWSPLVGSKSKATKAASILRYLKPENSSFWTVLYSRVTQNKQIATSEDTMKDCKPEEKFCGLKIN